MSRNNERRFERRPALPEDDGSGLVRRAHQPPIPVGPGMLTMWCPTCQRNASVRERDDTCLGCGTVVRQREVRSELLGKDRPR